MNNDEREIVNDDNNTPYIDTISARDLVNMLHASGVIEMPYLEGDVIDITSCPIDPHYTPRRDLPVFGDDVYSIRAETCATDYDGVPDNHYDARVVLHPHARITTRIAITLGDM